MIIPHTGRKEGQHPDDHGAARFHGRSSSTSWNCYRGKCSAISNASGGNGHLRLQIRIIHSSGPIAMLRFNKHSDVALVELQVGRRITTACGIQHWPHRDLQTVLTDTVFSLPQPASRLALAKPHSLHSTDTAVSFRLLPLAVVSLDHKKEEELLLHFRWKTVQRETWVNIAEDVGGQKVHGHGGIIATTYPFAPSFHHLRDPPNDMSSTAQRYKYK